VPSAAQPLLSKLIGVAGTIRADDEHAAALSEEYDRARIALHGADVRLSGLDAKLRSATKAFDAARIRLRQAAIQAYVTGQASAIDSSLLSNNLSDQSMVAVYGAIATGHVSRALKAFAKAAARAERLDAIARASSAAKARAVAIIGWSRALAVRLEQKAAADYTRIKTQLLALVGQKEFARLMSPMPVGSPYKGPNLAGSALGKVAVPLQSLAAVAAAKKLLGVPYVWGGASRKGVDCSGLTMLAWAAAGIPLEHSATAQWEESEPVPLSNLQPGDLLFYHFAHDGNTPITHVVMYLGSGPYGRATVIAAAQAGTKVSYAPVYFAGLVSAGRP
jgi:cell wall-associated NlpC family hydrolase